MEAVDLATKILRSIDGGATEIGDAGVLRVEARARFFEPNGHGEGGVVARLEGLVDNVVIAGGEVFVTCGTGEG